MIYRMIDLPSNVVGFNASWQISDKDVEEVLTPSVVNHVEKKGQSSCLLVFNDLNRNLKMSTLKSIERLKNWGNKLKRIAVVAESNSAQKMIEDMDTPPSMEVKGFSHEEMKEAIDWAAAS